MTSLAGMTLLSPRGFIIRVFSSLSQKKDILTNFYHFCNSANIIRYRLNKYSNSTECFTDLDKLNLVKID